jgi:hypothetical protein
MIQIDWLQINFRNKKGFFDLSAGFELIDTGKQTQAFCKVYELNKDGRRVGVITAEPRSEVIPKETMIIKFENDLLYNSGIHAIITNWFNVNNFEFKGFSRLDVCYDFNYFAKGVHPKQFIDMFLKGEIRKTDKTKVYTIAETGHELRYEYLRFGSSKSELSYYLYNKSKELTDVKDKGYIREIWRKNGLNEHDAWRLEFRLQSDAKQLINTFTGEVKTMREIGLDLLQQKNLQTLYFSLAAKYFDFRYAAIYGADSNVSRWPRINLFEFRQYEYTIKSPGRKLQSGRADRAFIKKLCYLNDELMRRGYGESHELKYFESTISYMLVKHDLVKWAKYKEFVPNSVIDRAAVMD